MSQTIEVTIDDSGRLIIPAPIDQELGLTPGMMWVVEENTTGELSLRSVDDEAYLVEENGVLMWTGTPLVDLRNWVQHDREERINTLIQRAGL